MFEKTRLLTLASLGLLLNSALLQADDKTTFSNQPIQTQTEAAKNVQIDIKKLSESFGHFIARNLKSPGLNLNLDDVIEGMRAQAAGKPAPLSEKEFEEMVTAAHEKGVKEQAEKNLKSANDFMSKNSKVKGVTEIVPEKLQYSVLKEGTGPVVEQHGTPKINYVGRYQDGTVFNSSEDMKGPITVPLDQTIPGFSKGIIGMKEGEKRRLYIHPDLGYGTATGGQLPPNELLIFDIEVVKAQSDEKPKLGNPSLDNDDDEDDDDYDDDDDDYNVQSNRS